MCLAFDKIVLDLGLHCMGMNESDRSLMASLDRDHSFQGQNPLEPCIRLGYLTVVSKVPTLCKGFMLYGQTQGIRLLHN